MDYLQILGIGAAILTTIANIPQAIKIIKTRSTKSISTATYGFLFTGVVLWFIYGILKDDIPIMLANAASAILSGIILVMKITGKKQAEANGEQ